MGKPTASVQPVPKQQEEPVSPEPSLPEVTKESDRLLNGLTNSQDITSVTKPSAVSLLGQGCLPNGDMDSAKSDNLKGKTDSVSQRLKEATGSSSQSVLKLTMPCPAGSVSKNVVINKVHPSTATKVLSSTQGKVLVNSSQNKSVTNSTSILSPRVSVTAGSKVMAPGKVTMVSGTSCSSGSKVITVSTPISGECCVWL